MSEICVAHLVREKNGISPFKAFLDSYRVNPGGTVHDLLLIFKGFDNQVVPAEYRAQLEGISYRTLFLPDEGFDVVPYFQAARRFDYRYFCFLNSFSVLLDDAWLLKLYKHISREDVGVVSATGSYESLYHNLMRSWPRSRPLIFWLKLLVRNRDLVWNALRKRFDFASFPNYHLRINAFMIRRETMLKLKAPQYKDKEDGHRFESGRSGWTQQIQKMGLRALVVGRDGVAYEKENWCKSFTFRSGEQQNLLVADNQTRRYQDAGPELRQELEAITWGPAPE